MASLLAISCILDPATGNAITSAMSFKVFHEPDDEATDPNRIKNMKIGKLAIMAQFPRNTCTMTYIYFGKEGVVCI